MISEAIVTCSRSRPRLKARLRRALHVVGYDTADWMRIVMYRRCFTFVRSLAPERVDALEISAGPQWAREFQFRSYTATAYPGFDICFQTLPARFDLIIADQVFEHFPLMVWAFAQTLPHGGAPVLPRAVPQATADETIRPGALVHSCFAR
jgi:hypothetical protein